MATAADATVDICLVSGAAETSHPLARDFPIELLTRISARFAKVQKAGGIVVDGNTGRFVWRIRDASGLLSIKGMKIVFIWLCSHHLPVLPGEKRTNYIPRNLGGVPWSVAGFAAVRQALKFLDLQGELKDQNHLTDAIRSFLLTRWNFAWDDIVLVWLCLGEGDELRSLLVEQVHAYINDPRMKTQNPKMHRDFMLAIDGYFGRADDLKQAYRAHTEREVQASIFQDSFHGHRTGGRRSSDSVSPLPSSDRDNHVPKCYERSASEISQQSSETSTSTLPTKRRPQSRKKGRGKGNSGPGDKFRPHYEDSPFQRPSTTSRSQEFAASDAHRAAFREAPQARTPPPQYRSRDEEYQTPPAVPQYGYSSGSEEGEFVERIHKKPRTPSPLKKMAFAIPSAFEVFPFAEINSGPVTNANAMPLGPRRLFGDGAK